MTSPRTSARGRNVRVKDTVPARGQYYSVFKRFQELHGAFVVPPAVPPLQYNRNTSVYCVSILSTHNIPVKRQLYEDVTRQEANLQFFWNFSFCHTASGRFFGQTYSSPARVGTVSAKGTATSAQVIKLTAEFNTPVVFHTRLADPDVVLVLELVLAATHPKTNIPLKMYSMGWSIVRLFSEQHRQTLRIHSGDDAQSTSYEATIYKGTPRSLMQLREPIERNLQPIAGCHCDLKMALLPEWITSGAVFLLPEFLFVGLDSKVPGLWRHLDRAKNSPFLPMRPTPDKLDVRTWTISAVKIGIGNDFEKKLLEQFCAHYIFARHPALVSAESKYNVQMIAKQWARSPQTQIRTRLLRAGVHNGLTWVKQPTLAILRETAGADGHPLLTFDGTLELHDVFDDSPQCAIVCELEYTLVLPPPPPLEKSAVGQVSEHSVCVGIKIFFPHEILANGASPLTFSGPFQTIAGDEFHRRTMDGFAQFLIPSALGGPRDVAKGKDGNNALNKSVSNFFSKALSTNVSGSTTAVSGDSTGFHLASLNITIAAPEPPKGHDVEAALTMPLPAIPSPPVEDNVSTSEGASETLHETAAHGDKLKLLRPPKRKEPKRLDSLIEVRSPVGNRSGSAGIAWAASSLFGSNSVFSKKWNGMLPQSVSTAGDTSARIRPGSVKVVALQLVSSLDVASVNSLYFNVEGTQFSCIRHDGIAEHELARMQDITTFVPAHEVIVSLPDRMTRLSEYGIEHKGGQIVLSIRAGAVDTRDLPVLAHFHVEALPTQSSSVSSSILVQWVPHMIGARTDLGKGMEWKPVVVGALYYFAVSGALGDIGNSRTRNVPAPKRNTNYNRVKSVNSIPKVHPELETVLGGNGKENSHVSRILHKLPTSPLRHTGGDLSTDIVLKQKIGNLNYLRNCDRNEALSRHLKALTTTPFSVSSAVTYGSFIDVDWTVKVPAHEQLILKIDANNVLSPGDVLIPLKCSDSALGTSFQVREVRSDGCGDQYVLDPYKDNVKFTLGRGEKANTHFELHVTMRYWHRGLDSTEVDSANVEVQLLYGDAILCCLELQLLHDNAATIGSPLMDCVLQFPVPSNLARLQQYTHRLSFNSETKGLLPAEIVVLPSVPIGGKLRTDFDAGYTVKAGRTDDGEYIELCIHDYSRMCKCGERFQWLFYGEDSNFQGRWNVELVPAVLCPSVVRTLSSREFSVPWTSYRSATSVIKSVTPFPFLQNSEILFGYDAVPHGDSQNELLVRLEYPMWNPLSGQNVISVAIMLQSDDVCTMHVVPIFLECPAITKTFDMVIPPTAKDVINKKIRYTNTTGKHSDFEVSTTRPDQLSFKTERMSLEDGESHYMGLRFILEAFDDPPGDLFIFVNDVQTGKTSEALQIRFNTQQG